MWRGKNENTRNDDGDIKRSGEGKKANETHDEYALQEIQMNF